MRGVDVGVVPAIMENRFDRFRSGLVGSDLREGSCRDVGPISYPVGALWRRKGLGVVSC